MEFSHAPRATSAVLDDPDLVSSAALVPVLALEESAGMRELVDEDLTVPTDKGATAGFEGVPAGRGDGRRRGHDR